MTELEELRERIRILEQRSRRLRNVGVGLALFVIAGLAFAQQRQGATPRAAVPDVIEAKKFVLKDDNGAKHAVLGTVPDRETGTNKGYLNADGLVVSDIRVIGGSMTAPKFVVKDDSNIEGYLDSNGLVLYKNVPVVQGKGRPFAWANSEYFKLVDENGTERVVIGSATTVNAKTRAATTEPVSSLTLFDKAGKVLFRAP